ncbi:MAG: hypothetical protein NC311_10865 [Muribaculaceae bacterium]|nr:hypothetical protein [Muribaculaceae bacterium]
MSDEKEQPFKSEPACQKEVVEVKLKTIRTINGALQELRAMDKHCAITENCLRQLCASGAIPYRLTGNRKLVAVEDVLQYFNGEEAETEQN